ncbi:MAG: hypothetical protein C0478_07185 [Planctomyces sp.]|nr:hypothetical protein [Planctomyces sp.]
MPLFVTLTLALIFMAWLIAEWRGNVWWRLPLSLLLAFSSYSFAYAEGLVKVAKANANWSTGVDQLLVDIHHQLTSGSADEVQRDLREILKELDPPGWQSRAERFNEVVSRVQSRSPADERSK